MHLVRVSEPWEYEGPNPIRALGSGIVRANGSREYYLLDVLSPFEVDRETVAQLVVSPRNAGISLMDIVEGEGTVGIARVKAGAVLVPGERFSFDQTDYIAIGDIERIG